LKWVASKKIKFESKTNRKGDGVAQVGFVGVPGSKETREKGVLGGGKIRPSEKKENDESAELGQRERKPKMLENLQTTPDGVCLGRENAGAINHIQQGRRVVKWVSVPCEVEAGLEPAMFGSKRRDRRGAKWRRTVGDLLRQLDTAPNTGIGGQGTQVLTEKYRVPGRSNEVENGEENEGVQEDRGRDRSGAKTKRLTFARIRNEGGGTRRGKASKGKVEKRARQIGEQSTGRKNKTEPGGRRLQEGKRGGKGEIRFLGRRRTVGRSFSGFSEAGRVGRTWERGFGKKVGTLAKEQAQPSGANNKEHGVGIQFHKKTK